MNLTSPVFKDNQQIPDKYAYKKENINPPLVIEKVPEEAESLVLIMDDPDGIDVNGEIWDHWIVFNIPPDIGSIPEDWDPDDPVVRGKTDYNENAYRGPNPPDSEHTYHFRLYAIDTILDLDPHTTKKELEDAIREHMLEENILRAKYGPV